MGGSDKYEISYQIYFLARNMMWGLKTDFSLEILIKITLVVVSFYLI